jgi:hypothetical protein
VSESRIYRAWNISCLVGFVFFAAGAVSGRLGLWVVTGSVLLGWGLAVATNWRGAADAWPKTRGRGSFTTTVSTPVVQLLQGCFALFGAGLLIAGILTLAR